MEICIFGSASNKIDKDFIDKTFSLGKALAKNGHNLVYGGGSEGLMGAAVKGFKEGGGKVHGIIPKFFEDSGYEAIYYDADTLTMVKTMAERKTMMEDGCDAFIITPGGTGTYEEFFEVLTLKQLGRHKKAIAIYNLNGYFDKLNLMLSQAIEQGFMEKECKKLFYFASTEKEIIDYIENYSSDNVVWSSLKRN